MITADIPLAAEAIEKAQRRLIRAANVTRQRPFVTPDDARFYGYLTCQWDPDRRPDSLSQRDRQAFAAELEKWCWKCNVVVAKCNLLFTLHS